MLDAPLDRPDRRRQGRARLTRLRLSCRALIAVYRRSRGRGMIRLPRLR